MTPVSRRLPAGTVTFLFTDVEGSTKLLHELGDEAYAEALAQHRRVVREAFASHGGVEVDTQGDAFFVVFPSAAAAVAAARAAQGALTAGPIRVRMGLHTGTPHLTDDGYVGEDVHLGARIAAAGHGGQVLLSGATRPHVEGDLMDLGEHRLKDFAEAVAIFQLGADRFPPLKTISNTNLPRPASSFIGREREVAELAALLQSGARLVTLTGPGGSGKTRLAIEAAAELVPAFKAGVFWVGLAALRDPALVVETIAQTLGAKDGLAAHVGERELLLLLDNLEQVIDAASELAGLVEACPNLRLLVTSRELLRVRGEREYAVPPLAEPDAVELFCARSRLEADAVIAQLCHRLDNLPLAVELAAARTSVLSPAQILERLAKRLDLLKGGRDAEARQQTLRATIEWSHDLLSAEERQLFARLSVFRGGCALEAAEAVCDADLDTLQSLVDKSLLRHTGERFWMLETIREYATERLEESGDAEDLGRRHAEYFFARAEEAEPNIHTYSPEWLARLERDHDNLRAALDWFEAAGETQLVLQMAGALWWFWSWKQHLEEGLGRLDAALAADDSPTAARANALTGASELALARTDIPDARRRAEEALTLHRSLGNTWATAYTLALLGNALAQAGDALRTQDSSLEAVHLGGVVASPESAELFQEAERCQEEAVRLLGDLGDDANRLNAHFILAWIYWNLGKREHARTVYEETLREARAAGNKWQEALSLGALANIFGLFEGRIDYAVRLLKEALRINQLLGDRYNVAVNLSRFAHALARTGNAQLATELLAASGVLYEDVGARRRHWAAEQDEKTRAMVHAQLDDAAFNAAWEKGRNLTLDDAVGLALGQEGFDA
jgi:predicted ATPase/class 3 adenylate cyclase